MYVSVERLSSSMHCILSRSSYTLYANFVGGTNLVVYANSTPFSFTRLPAAVEDTSGRMRTTELTDAILSRNCRHVIRYTTSQRAILAHSPAGSRGRRIGNTQTGNLGYVTRTDLLSHI